MPDSSAFIWYKYLYNNRHFAKELPLIKKTHNIIQNITCIVKLFGTRFEKSSI